jgi:two-component system, cell cycle sensor histidine kinase and response regulator CckA
MKAKNNRDLEFNLLIENLNQGYATLDPVYENGIIVDFRCIEINDLGLKLFNSTRESLVGNTLIGFDPTLKERALIRTMKDVFLTGNKKKINGHFFKGADPKVDVDLELTIYKIDDLAAILFRDITLYKRTEKELARSQDRYKTLVKSVFEYLYTVEFEDGNMVSQFHSKQCEKVTGYTHHEYQNDPNLWFKMVHPDDKQMVLDYVERRKSDPTLNKIEHRIIHKNGSVRWVSDHANLKHNELGEIIRIDGVIEDITDRKLAEILIGESEEKYRIIFETAVEGIFFVDYNGNIVDSNPSGRKLLEFSPEEINHINFYQLLLVSHRSSSDLNFRETMYDYEVLLHTKYNRAIYVNLNSVPVSLDNQERALIVLRDTTEKREFEKTLEESEHKYRTIFETAPYGMIVVRSKDNIVMAVNNKFIELMNFRLEEVLGRNVETLNFWKDKNNRSYFLEQLEREGELDNYRVQFLSNNYNNLDCILSARIIKYGKDEARLIIVQDITEILKTEEQLLLLNNAIEQAVEVVIITDRNGKILYVNSAFEKILGYPKEFMIGKFPNVLKSGKQPQEFYGNMWDTITKGNVWTGEIINKKKNNELCNQEISITPIKNNENAITHFVAVLRDVTEFKKISEEKDSLAMQLFHAQKMEGIGRLASGVAHDFNNMLSIILTSSELIRSLEPEEQILYHCENIETTCKQTSHIVKQLLLFSKETYLNQTIIDLNKLLSNTIKILQHSLGKDIEIKYYLNDVPSFIDADEIQLQQIVLNLALNARDAMPSGGYMNFTVRNVFLDDDFCKSRRSLHKGHYAELIVEDNGVGIPHELLNKIFDPFFTTKESGKGTGLGLSVVYGIVSSHNGYIEVFSEIDAGTRFHLYFPLTKHQVEIINIDQDGVVFKGNETLLIVDDEELILSSLKTSLTSLGYKVIVTNNGKDAVNLYKEYKINLVILDILMPKMDGIETYQNLYDYDTNVKVLFTTGLADQSKIVESGFINEYNLIRKPFLINELSQKIRNVLQHE